MNFKLAFIIIRLALLNLSKQTVRTCHKTAALLWLPGKTKMKV